MPTKPKAASAPTNVFLPAADMLNEIRAEASDAYKQWVPEATDLNITEVGNPILTMPKVRNEFGWGLFNKIGLTNFTARTYQNKFAFAKRGELGVGETVEEIAVNLLPEVAFPSELAEDLAHKRYIPDVRSIFHSINREPGRIPWTVQRNELRRAFYSASNFESFVSVLAERAASSDAYYEELYTKDLLRRAGNAGHYYLVDVPNIDLTSTEEDGKQFAKIVRSYARRVNEMSGDYNANGIMTHSPLSELYLFILPEVEAAIDVDVLSVAFNQGRADYPVIPVVVNDFGGLETAGVKAILVDKLWFNIYDTMLEVHDQHTAAGPYTTYYLYHQQIYSYSLFHTAIAFTSSSAMPTAITMTPDTNAVTSDLTRYVGLNTVVTGPTGDDTIWYGAVSYGWTSSTAGVTGIEITSDGKVTIPRGTPATTITVTATAKATAGETSPVTATTTITVNGGGTPAEP